MKKTNAALSTVLLAIFLDLITNGILVPIVPQLLANPDSKFYLLPSSVPISYAYIILGILIAVYPIMLFFATPVLGEYSDYVGRRKVMTLALGGAAAALAVFAIGVEMKSLTLLFIGRIIGGILGGNLSVAQAAIADITPPEKRAARFGLIGAAYGLGFIIGPVLGAILSDSSILPWFNASTPFWCAAVIAGLNAVLVWIFLPETREYVEEFKITWHRALHQIVHAYRLKDLRWIFATNFLFQAGIALFATFFSVFLIATFGFDQTAVGYYIGYAGIWLIISQALVLRPLSRKFSDWSMLRFFLLAGAVSVFAYYIPTQIVGLLIVGALFAVTNGISMAVLPSIASCRASAKVQGQILGINASVQSLAQAIPPILAGYLAAEIAPAAPVYFAGGIILLAWLVFLAKVRRNS